MMRGRPSRILVTLLTLTLGGTSLLSARAADEPNFEGKWKLQLITPLRDSDLLLLNVTKQDSKWQAAIVETVLPPQVPLKVKNVAVNGDEFGLDLGLGAVDLDFRGKAGKEGKVYGSVKLNGQLTPALLVKATEKKLAKETEEGVELIKEYMAARNVRDPKLKAKKLTSILEKEPAGAKLTVVYADLLQIAEAAGFSEKTVAEFADTLISNAKPYGESYVGEVQAVAMKSLAGQKSHAELALKLGQNAEKSFGATASTQIKAEIARGILDAAKLLGKKEIEAETNAKILAYEAQLDEEYHKNVPPFKPDVVEGRKDKAADRVVLLELFTGAQCPPCVAADVAFDALNLTYKPTELITLQYHLHIPGPDPLTNSDSVARSEYYPDLQGTPATYFNGKSEAPGGGPMAFSKNKYDEYRQVIDGALKEKKKATIDLQLDREGEDLKIKVAAQSEVAKQEKDPDQAAKVKLRLAIVEEQIRYTGGNRLRFHHHVVRALPGGAVGKPFEGGEIKVEQTVNLANLRKSLEEYLSGFTKEHGSFPSTLPSLSLENIVVVAFVQDDRDKSVLHAVQLPVPAAKKATSE